MSKKVFYTEGVKRSVLPTSFCSSLIIILLPIQPKRLVIASEAKQSAEVSVVFYR
jgi:hypothetical protein